MFLLHLPAKAVADPFTCPLTTMMTCSLWATAPLILLRHHPLLLLPTFQSHQIRFHPLHCGA